MRRVERLAKGHLFLPFVFTGPDSDWFTYWWSMSQTRDKKLSLSSPRTITVTSFSLQRIVLGYGLNYSLWNRRVNCWEASEKVFLILK